MTAIFKLSPTLLFVDISYGFLFLCISAVFHFAAAFGFLPLCITAISCTDKTFSVCPNQVSPSRRYKGLFYKFPVRGVLILDEGPLHGFFMGIFRYIYLSLIHI